jgi:hypothetical protein
MAPKKSARICAADPALLDRRLVSTAEGALPIHTRISVHHAKGWEDGLITQAFSCLNNDGKAVSANPSVDGTLAPLAAAEERHGWHER